MAMRKQHVSFDTSPYKVITISVDTTREDEATMQNSTKVFFYSFLLLVFDTQARQGPPWFICICAIAQVRIDSIGASGTRKT